MEAANATRWYRGTAAAWAVVFAFVGLWFLLAPELLVSSINAGATLLALEPAVSGDSGSVLHVLTVSLMTLLTFMAAASARQPGNDALYRGLMISKIVSTLGFLYLARNGSGWFLCAFGDGFVAFTLALARAQTVDGPLAGLALALRRYEGRGPFYEVWYGRVALEDGRAFWFRYTTLDGKVSESATWAILFEKGGAVIHTGKNVRPLSAARLDRELPFFESAEGKLTEGCAEGRAGSLKWRLRFSDSGRTFRHVPAALRTLRLAKSEYNTCYLDARFSGTVELDGKTIEISEAPGAIGHIYGKRQALGWAWAHCNTFENAPGVVFEALSARVALGSKPSPPLSSFVLYADGKRHVFPTLRKIASTPTEWSEGKWTFGAIKGRYELQGEASVDPSRVALVTYTDTDGSNLWCRNSKLASLKVALIDRRTGQRREFACQDSAAFEWVNRTNPGRVHLE